MKRCLAIPGTFVPANEPMTQLVYKQLRRLPFETEVCALRYWEEDATVGNRLEQDDHYRNFRVHWVDDYRKVLFSIRNVNLPSALHHMQKYIDTAVSMYDGQEYIYTSSFPCYTVRAGMRIKEKNPAVKWIANFTDPINHSPYKVSDKETYQAYSLPEKIAFRLYCRYYVVDEDEINALENADLLLFICPEQREFMLRQYELYTHRIPVDEIRAKSVIVPLNYVPEWNTLESLRDEAHAGFLLSHYGRVYGLRIIEEFIYAMRMFLDRHPDFPLVFEQYGEFRKTDRKLMEKLSLQDHVRIHEKIPYEACLQKMKASDAVLIFDTILPEDEIQPYLPSKVIEYSLLQKNTLAITTKTSPTWRIMQESGALAASYDRNDILDKLELLCLGSTPSVIHYASTDEEAVQDLLDRIGALND
ncbi:MAG: hypothetical protein IJH98_09955 [Solobacterium sp.]|nr:hypothetical protein [Solobacterium sp.]